MFYQSATYDVKTKLKAPKALNGTSSAHLHLPFMNSTFSFDFVLYLTRLSEFQQPAKPQSFSKQVKRSSEGIKRLII